MAKKVKNERCPFKDECEKKCTYEMHEKDCGYYAANATDTNHIDDQWEDNFMPDELFEQTKSELVYIPIEELFSHPDNPRKDLGELDELAESIKVKGIMQNLTVIKGHWWTMEEYLEAAKAEGVAKGTAKLSYDAKSSFVPSGYTVIIGHRRLGAAKLAGLDELPCVIVDMSPQDQVATMLLENMQRTDLTVYEQAKGFQLMLDFGDSIETVAEKSGFSTTTIRRRVKLLELDEEKFKKSEQRNVSLFEYMELDKIKDIERKNRVLDSIGTPNFNNELQKAITEEADQEYVDNTEVELAKFATKIEDSAGYIYVTDYGTWNKKDVTVPDDADTVKYYYKLNGRYIALYKKKEDVPADEEAERIKAEKNADRERRKDGLREASERAYTLRKEAIEAISNSHALKHLSGIIAFLMKKTCDSHYITVDNGDIADIVGFDTESEEYEDWTEEEFNEHLYGLIETQTKDKAAQCLLKYAYALCEDGNNRKYYDWYAKHDANESLDKIYIFLCSLGYEMSDEEKALQNGTHELFIKEDEE